MKEKVDLQFAIYAETRSKYPHINWEKFEILYHGWAQQSVRHGRNKQFFSVSWKRGWLSKKDADDLRKYIGIL